MKKITQLSVALAFGLIATNAHALTIETSASGTFFGDTYGYEFAIDDNGGGAIYSAKLENISLDDGDPIGSYPMIDLVAFNMTGGFTYGTDFDILNIVSNWTFTESSGGIQFDYVGDADSPGDKLAPTEELTFDFVFYTAGHSLDIWLNSSQSLGTGIGGGGDVGQVAVSFQSLGEDGADSDLLASNWEGAPIPEPATMLLFGTGLVGLVGSRLRKKKK